MTLVLALAAFLSVSFANARSPVYDPNTGTFWVPYNELSTLPANAPVDGIKSDATITTPAYDSASDEQDSMTTDGSDLPTSPPPPAPIAPPTPTPPSPSGSESDCDDCEKAAAPEQKAVVEHEASQAKQAQKQASSALKDTSDQISHATEEAAVGSPQAAAAVVSQTETVIKQTKTQIQTALNNIEAHAEIGQETKKEKSVEEKLATDAAAASHQLESLEAVKIDIVAKAGGDVAGLASKPCHHCKEAASASPKDVASGATNEIKHLEGEVNKVEHKITKANEQLKADSGAAASIEASDAQSRAQKAADEASTLQSTIEQKVAEGKLTSGAADDLTRVTDVVKSTLEGAEKTAELVQDKAQSTALESAGSSEAADQKVATDEAKKTEKGETHQALQKIERASERVDQAKAEAADGQPALAAKAALKAVEAAASAIENGGKAKELAVQEKGVAPTAQDSDEESSASSTHGEHQQKKAHEAVKKAIEIARKVIDWQKGIKHVDDRSKETPPAEGPAHKLVTAALHRVETLLATAKTDLRQAKKDDSASSDDRAEEKAARAEKDAGQAIKHAVEAALVVERKERNSRETV